MWSSSPSISSVTVTAAGANEHKNKTPEPKRATYSSSFGIKTTLLTIIALVLMCLGALYQNDTINVASINIDNNMGVVKDASSSSVGGPVPEEAAKKEEGLSSSPQKKFSVAKYQFPSVQQRLQYYMGDWYNRSDWTVHDSDCKALREVTDIMLRTTDIKE